MTSPGDGPATPAPRTPLRIVRVVPPEPHASPGSYEVRLELSRPLTEHERRALHHPGWRLQAVGALLTLGDTTLERVAAAAAELDELVHDVEGQARRLEQEAERRAEAYAVRLDGERQRLEVLAESIRFSGAGSAPR